MLTQPSSPTYYARLQFSNASSCVDWLETVPLDDTVGAHEMIAAQVGLLARTELAALERLRMLEVLLQPALHLQAELARRFIGRALPLSIVEYSVWNSALELWQTLFAGYMACLLDCLADESSLQSQAPLLALRCVDLAAGAIHEHHRVYREVPTNLWAQLNTTYALAERLGVENTEIDDPLRVGAATRTPLAAFGRVLVAQLGNPYALSPRQMNVMYRWTGLWEGLVSVDPTPPAPGMTSVRAVDLQDDAPTVPANQIDGSPSVRYLDLEKLGQALRRTLTLLRAGHDPASLELGDDCRQPGTERLLTLLYVQWCGAGMGQLSAERERLEDARACVGRAAVFRQLESESEAFRTGASAIRMAYGPLTENWHISSASAPGFIGVSRGPECDERIQHHQLVALKRRSASTFQLGVTQWLKLENDGDLSIGVRLWPGAPQFLAVELAGLHATSSAQGVLLPAAPEMRTPQTLVLAPGTFRAGLRLMLGSAPARAARLTRLMERGIDFERAAVEFIDQAS